ncbi:TonB-dependent receptor [Sphingobacterium mizutaii NBRC 14946 = DSM 11724]|uniref:Outer membrane cobalamin translocator n=2 Tax=Sphingobacterium mizutaii TaxID=1010 RepID=A0AAJ5BYQ5_9SPHI|nr:TonB-dependent receptor plug domain-containing protein [Sphingobacterium mizutaii]GEM67007.1 TonB-dependent receptor [Sphingobacterium mizutaii NBRC 14946 = DSM 11724]SDL63008.1 Outer membrane receptor proteins, mostly Fe transport [Sphingobacterium mizutaii]SNV36095.1 Outer membrane cobalamin translocator [Sphingobacterium mizutaii]
MKQFYLSTLFLFICFVGFAQNSTITGKVHLLDGTPVSKATVRIEGTPIVCVSDDEGLYKLDQVPYGKQTILVTSIEIKSKRLPIEVNKPSYDLHIHIDPRGEISLDEVRVQGNSVKREIETKGFAVNVIETKEASTRNIQTNELLDRTVGVRVRQSGGLGSEVQYNLNGMTGRSVGIFIDGIEISTYGSSFNLNNIPPSMIDRIEVYKGVLPAHLTGDLLGGAINIVLKKGTSSNNLSASVSYGSFNTTQSDISGLYRNSKTGFTTRVSGSFLNSDNDYEIWGKFSKYIEPNGVVRRNYRTKRFFDGYRALSGRFEFGFTDVKWADAFFLGYNISDSHKEIQHGQTMGTPYMGRTSDATANVLSLTYNKKNLFVPGLSLNTNAVHSFRSTNILDTIPWAYNWDGQIRLDLNGDPIRRLDGAQQGKPAMTDIDRQVTNIRTNLSYDILSGHRFSVNHVFYTVDRKDKNLLIKDGNTGINSSNDLAKNVVSFNYEAQTFSNKLTTNLFYKIYQQSIASKTFTGVIENGQTKIVENVNKDNRVNYGYGLAASYKLFNRLILLASGERAVRMPVDVETFGSPEDNVLANPGISPEISDNYNAGFRLGTYDFGDHRFSIGTNVFWRNTKDRIMPRANELINSQEIELTQYINLGLSQSLGFEGELTYAHKDKLTLLFNFSKFNSLFKQQFDPTSGQQMTYYNKQIPNEPFYTMNGNVHYRLDNIIQKSSQLNLFYNIGYVAPFSTVWPESDWFVTPAQYAQNLGVSYVFPSKKIILALDVKNVFNAELYDNFGVQKPGRGFYLKLNYSINNI